MVNAIRGWIRRQEDWLSVIFIQFYYGVCVWRRGEEDGYQGLSWFQITITMIKPAYLYPLCDLMECRQAGGMLLEHNLLVSLTILLWIEEMKAWKWEKVKKTEENWKFDGIWWVSLRRPEKCHNQLKLWAENTIIWWFCAFFAHIEQMSYFLTKQLFCPSYDITCLSLHTTKFAFDDFCFI